MAGHVPRRVLRKPTVHKCLLEGTPLFQSDDVSSNCMAWKFMVGNWWKLMICNWV